MQRTTHAADRPAAGGALPAAAAAKMPPLSVTVVGDGGSFTSQFAARIDNLDAARELGEAEAQQLIELLHTHKVICLAGQDPAVMTPEWLERLSNHFGAPTPHPSRATRLPGCDAIQLLTNVEKQELSEETAAEAAIPGMHSAGRVGRQLGCVAAAHIHQQPSVLAARSANR